MPEFRDTNALKVISEAIEANGCRSLLEPGCGKGLLKPRIEAMGCRWVGVDPQADGDGIVRAGAEALPFADASFDAVLFLNALHHVPIPLMQTALREAARVLSAPDAPLIVIEPDVAGDLSEVLKRVDDETAIRTAAQEAIDSALAAGHIRQMDRFAFLRVERYRDFEDLASRLIAADPARGPAISAQEAALRAEFERLSVAEDGRLTLRQPMNVWLLAKRGG